MARGMRCPSCNCPRYKLIRTGKISYKYFGVVKTVFRRRYACEHCGRRWWSNELPEEDIEKLIEESEDWED